ncbi:MAG: LacI family transcriptional regulator [Chloroflexota bacterium]|nr:LacI family transcriptional regulator [Chloroflexota bacterium]
MLTIADVARAAGVSITTVSRVLSPGAVPHPVRPDTAERVRVAARELNFFPSPMARGLASRRSGLIGLIVPDLADPHYPHIAAAVEDGAREAELSVLICNTFGEAQRTVEYLMLMQARRVDAVVLSGGTSLSAVDLLALNDCKVPMVLIGRPTIPVPWPHVSIDNRDGGRQATRHLLQIGRKRAIHLAGPSLQTTMADRAAGYREAMQGASVSAEVIDSDGTPEQGYELLKTRLLSQPLPPDAVFAATDRLAIAALAVAADRHLHVPGELAIIGFDDIALAAQLRPSLSTMAQPAYELGRVAISMARRLVAGETVQPVSLSVGLAARESTLGPGGRYT